MKILERIADECISWFDAVFGNLPGVIGVKIRYFLYCSRFAGCGRKVSFSQNCRIRDFHKIRIGNSASFGPSTQILADRSSGGIEIGDHVSCNSNVMINADKSLGIKIGAYCLIGPNAVLRAADHAFADRKILIQKQGDKPGRIVLEDDVWVGANAVILKNVTIKKGAVVAAGAVVVDDVHEYQIVGGVPARPIGQRG